MLCEKDTERSKTILSMLTRELLAPVGRSYISKPFVAVPGSVVFPLQNSIISAHLFCSTSECNCVHIMSKGSRAIQV